MILKTTIRKSKSGGSELIIPLEQIKQAMLGLGYAFVKLPKSNEDTAQFLSNLLRDGYRARNRSKRSKTK